MPVGSEAPALPHTWRPVGVRMVGIVAGFGLFAVSLGVWVAIGPDLRAMFGVADKATMGGIAVIIVVCLHALLRARLTVSEQGLVVVNGYRRRELAWPQVVAIRIRSGAPWAEMDLADGTEIPVMALQASDGARALAAIRGVRALLAERTPEDR